MRSVAFMVYGKPEPAGSKRAFPVKRGDRMGVAVTDANPRSKRWQEEVRKAWARTAPVYGHDERLLLEGPLELTLEFFLARPRSHFGKGRNATVLKTSAPSRPTSRPDTTKLVRGVEDALTGLVWKDDAQIVWQRAEKHYALDLECCSVIVREAGS